MNVRKESSGREKQYIMYGKIRANEYANVKNASIEKAHIVHTLYVFHLLHNGTRGLCLRVA